MPSYQLNTDTSQIEPINNNRIMVAAALVYLYTIHYVFMGVAHLLRGKVKSERLYDHGRRLVLYGIAALIGCNFLNYGVYHAIMAWIVLIWMLIMHAMAFVAQINQNHQNIALTGYYILIGAWLIGILAMYMFNALV